MLPKASPVASVHFEPIRNKEKVKKDSHWSENLNNQKEEIILSASVSTSLIP
jgi:hypothetical protein